METFPDDGDVDMWACLKTYAEVGYRYMIMPDHVPQIAGRDPEATAFAFCFGHIAGQLEALRAEYPGLMAAREAKAA